MARISRARPRSDSGQLKLGAGKQAALLQLLKDAGTAANEARTVEAALAAAVSLIGEHQRWALGHAYLPTDDGGECAPTGAWYVRPGLDARRFQAATARARFRSGAGLVGYVLEARRPLWVADVHKEARWTRDDRGLGLRSAVFYPVMAHGAVQAVLEFFSDEFVAPEPALESVIGSVAYQLTRALDRHELARQTAMAFELEQRQIGQELHDRLGQSLSALDWMARGLQQSLAPQAAAVAAKVEELVHGIGVAKLELRRLAKGLMPVDLAVGDGLAAALKELAVRCRELYGVECRYEGDPKADSRDATTAAHLFRIGQEAVRNAAEHGHPSRIAIRLTATDGRLELEVRDDGAGFAMSHPPSRGMGVRIMEHRAQLIGGTLEIHSSQGEGTLVRCLVPVAAG